MTKFVQLNLPTTHAGVERLQNAASFFSSLSARVQRPRNLATMLTMACVAAVLVAAEQLIDTITEGHLLAAWLSLWAVGFAALGLLNRPAVRFAQTLRHAGAAWAQKRRLAAQDEKMWKLALTDARVMADILAAMAAARSD
jgi:hypothetical protein